jgi:O-antigen/teichoic acid export membrane protein
MTLLLNKPLEIKYLIILYGLGVIPAALLLDWVFQGVEKMEYIGLGRILVAAVYAGLVLWFVKDSEQLLLVPLFWVASNLLGAGLLIFIFVRSFGKPRLSFNLIFWRSLLRQALPMGFALIMAFVFVYIDTVMLGFMKSNEEVGHYNAAYKIVLFFIGVVFAYSAAIYPVISNYYKTSLDSLKRLLHPTVKLIVTMGLPLAVGGTILAKPIMHLLYGTAYDNGIIALQILLWWVVGSSINNIYAVGLLGCDKQNRFALVMTVIVVTNLILNFILIPPFGLIGAAIATVSAEAIAFPIYYISFRRVVKVNIHTYIPKPLLCSILMALFLYWGLNVANLNVLLLIPAGAVIYFISFYLIRGISRDEIRMVQSAIFTNRRGEQ